MSSGKGGFPPSHDFRIVLPIPKTAVEEADEAISEGAQSLVVVGAVGTTRVVVVSGAGRVGQRTECPEVGGVGEVTVADEARQHHLLFT